MTEKCSEKHGNTRERGTKTESAIFFVSCSLFATYADTLSAKPHAHLVNVEIIVC